MLRGYCSHHIRSSGSQNGSKLIVLDNQSHVWVYPTPMMSHGVWKASQILEIDLCLSTKNRFKKRYFTWNVGTLTGRSRELANNKK